VLTDVVAFKELDGSGDLRSVEGDRCDSIDEPATANVCCGARGGSFARKERLCRTPSVDEHS
jgi:hypothetical protein